MYVCRHVGICMCVGMYIYKYISFCRFFSLVFFSLLFFVSFLCVFFSLPQCIEIFVKLMHLSLPNNK